MGRPPAFWRLRHKAVPLQVGPIGPAFVPRSLAWLLGFGNPGAADRESGLPPLALLHPGARCCVRASARIVSADTRNKHCPIV